MRYELMFPHQIRKAIRQHWPLVIPVGVLEYHAEHCAVGVDTLLVQRAAEALEEDLDLVLFPPFPFGAASYAIAPPEDHGTLHVSAPTIHALARELFRGLLRIGFRNIHAFIHHQSENFTAGMPTDLAFKLAARESLFEFLEREHGEGWWGNPRMQNYYAAHGTGSDPFSWIRIHPFMDEETQRKFPIDHASKQETSLMLAFCPEGVNMRKFTPKQWYARGARQASLAYGRTARKMILARMRKILA